MRHKQMWFRASYKMVHIERNIEIHTEGEGRAKIKVSIVKKKKKRFTH